MKNILTTTIVAGLAMASSALAQNANYANQDLVVYFQNPGGAFGADQTLMVTLGNAALLYRDASSSILNISNIGSLLSSTFGANWFNETTLSMGAASAWSSNALSSGLQNADPHRTTYTSRNRNDIGGDLGLAGAANSSQPTINIGNMAALNNSILGAVGRLETQSTTTTLVETVGNSQIEETNPSNGQSTAWNSNYPGGTSDLGFAGTYGAFGGVENIELAIDIYRMQARNNIAGQDGFGEAVGAGRFEGSVVLDTAGNLSFVTVPEPTTAALLGLAAGALGFMRRRRNA